MDKATDRVLAQTTRRANDLSVANRKKERGVTASQERTDIRHARCRPNVLREQEGSNRSCISGPGSHEIYVCRLSMSGVVVARSALHVERTRLCEGGAVGRHLHIGIARLNKAIAEYSLARLEFTLLHPDFAEPPLIQRVGTRTPEEPVVRNWADTMKRVALLQSYIENAKTDDLALQREPSFERLTKTANHVAVLAWSMESMHRRSGGTIS